MAGSLNVGEHGQVLRFGVKESIVGTTPSLVFKKPDETMVTKGVGDGVSVGTADFIGDSCSPTLLTGEYVEYTVEVGLLDVTGDWQWRPEILFAGPSKLAKTDFKVLTVRE